MNARNAAPMLTKGLAPPPPNPCCDRPMGTVSLLWPTRYMDLASFAERYPDDLPATMEAISAAPPGQRAPADAGSG